MQQIDVENLKSFGKMIRKIRLQKSPSLNKLAFTTDGVTSATLIRIENGLVDFKFSTLVRLSQTLGIPLSELFTNYEYKNITDDV